MKIAFFDTHRFERKIFDRAHESIQHSVIYFETRLTPETAKLAFHFPVVCVFVNDELNNATLAILKAGGRHF